MDEPGPVEQKNESKVLLWSPVAYRLTKVKKRKECKKESAEKNLSKISKV